MTRMKNHTNELKSLISRLERKPNESFLPLANTPERFMDFVYFLRRQPGCRAHKTAIAAKFGITERQVRFYASAGDEIFGLFDASEAGFVRLTKLGKEFAYSKKEELVFHLKSEMQKMPIIQQFINADISEDLSPVIQAIESNEKWEEAYSLSSVERRASTIRSWVEFVREDSFPVKESEMVLFVKQHQSILSHLFSMKQSA